MTIHTRTDALNNKGAISMPQVPLTTGGSIHAS
jgi:hypothetical protein